MKIRMICMDLDGTALQPDRSGFSPRLEAALEAAHRQGIEIVVVTGRQYGLLPPVVKNHPLWENLVVLCNGGQIRRLGTGEVLESLYLEPAVLARLLKLAEEWELPIEFSVDSTLYLTQRSLHLQQGDPGLAFHRDVILASRGKTVASLGPMVTEPVEKVNLLCIPQALRERVQQAVAALNVCGVWASHNGMEITHSQAQKGMAMEKVCQMLNIPVEATMALGDSGNDISMLRRAGLGVAVGNAPDFVKLEADVVTLPYDQDGAAIAIERWALNRH